MLLYSLNQPVVLLAKLKKNYMKKYFLKKIAMVTVFITRTPVSKNVPTEYVVILLPLQTPLSNKITQQSLPSMATNLLSK